MASIAKRIWPNKVSYRVKINRIGIPVFSITFDTEDEAINWVLEHEPKYVKDPQKYIDWITCKRLTRRNNNGWSPYDL
ncbi:hypothetical protein UFOVP1357_45 [uncultured Caudovirales phage]|uniref:Uncharacterized protein n=1 Tax=uncultured Caudovirales phage TaxID=2100421 RepID=A0A6J5L0W3_9CAUD|nr:hypothetical protein UFOVP18_27 [uncultured Caudovirales phage]CAB4126853.1 hypothetical protein UFOVP82_29 [uncultured Caudovirales phage]CAB4132449.1 hypothetical protein UFOVP258_20 [uncultured Caudovirales phage]CAB4146341.1 hypothetical protein UFOVP502_12 [uncultured Caudovirales phage]CAB4200428.1 hypothetical protein UFOVP1357_45 [uncultured Caudovirales phage]